MDPEWADSALALIKFKAWAVTGLELIVTPEKLPIWRNYLANSYPMFPDSIANSSWELNNAMAKWPQMAWVERELYQNMWAISLPQDLAFIEPVFPAGVQDLRAALQSRAQQNAAASAKQNRDPGAELQRQGDIAESLRVHNNRMTTLTTDLMRAMSGRR
jgi:hypothetical protein